MFRRALSLLLFVGMIAGLTSSPARAAINGNIACSGGGYFQVVNDKIVAKVTADNTLVNKCRGTAVVPEGVTEIGNYGLADEEFMTNVSLPNSLTKIGGNGLAGTKLSTVNLPPNLRVLSQGALQYNGYMTSLVIPPLVTQIDTLLVFGAYGLCDIYFLGRTAPTVDSAAFAQICKTNPWVPGAPVGNGSPKAWVPQGATSYPAINSDFGGLTVQNGGAIVLFDGNGATAGSIPATQSVAVNANVQIPTNSGAGALARTGFRFLGWCTSKLDDGSGQCFTSGDNYAAPEGTTILYANWQGKPTVIYDGNGATSGSAPVDSLSPYEEESSVTVLGNTGSLERLGYSFGGWAAAADGSGTLRQAGDTFDIGTTNSKFYVKWNANTNVVTYNSNGGSSVANGSFVTGGQIAAAPTAPSRAGYDLAGWSATNGGSLIAFPYSPTDTAGITLYAKWSVKTTASVTYSGNGSTGGTVPIDVGSPYFFGATISVSANSGVLEKTGYKFIGWNTAADGSGTSYGATGSTTFVLPTSDVTLFAVWESLPAEVKAATTAPIDVKKSANAPMFMPKFDRSSATLTGKGKSAIKKIVESAGVDATYIVTGVAGKLPGVPNSFVEALAKSRAERLKAYFVKLGVKESSIVIKIKITEIGIKPKTKIISQLPTS